VVRPDGSACKAPATDDGKCHWHSERHREARLESSRKGGLRKTIELPSAPALTAERTRELIASVSESVVAGSLDPNTARALTYLLSLDRQLRDSEGLETRLDQLEARMVDVAAVKGSFSSSDKPRLKRVSDVKRVSDRHGE